VPALWTAAALTAGAAAAYQYGLARRPARARGRASVHQTWLANKALLGNARVRGLLLAQWLPNGLIVGAEALYVPYAGKAAGILFTAAAAGMLAGDMVIGRWTTSRQRRRLSLPLYGLLAGPYLAFVAHPATIVAAAMVATASFGYSACLGLQERLLVAAPEHICGQALGLAGAGMMSMQAIAAAATGALASRFPAGAVMAAAGVASLLASTSLVPHLRGREHHQRPVEDGEGSARATHPPDSPAWSPGSGAASRITNSSHDARAPKPIADAASGSLPADGRHGA
jgi:hypothetical protein